VEKVFTALAHCRVHIFIDRTDCPPWGILGGAAGSAPSAYIERQDGRIEYLRKANVAVAPGERVHLLTSGGGGYGDPLRREPGKVAEDVRLGYVSREAARAQFGVVLDASGQVLERETAKQRALRLTLSEADGSDRLTAQTA
jgi:N-methylhydantoinase B